jgi:hypothetical protein
MLGRFIIRELKTVEETTALLAARVPEAVIDAGGAALLVFIQPPEPRPLRDGRRR